ncbi:hypothetical protein ABFS82_14G282200 [Erythranthe guttata]
MTARSRLLGGANPPPPKSIPANDTLSAVEALNPDLVVIVAGLLCALICVLGLVTVARCALLRRITGRSSASPAPSSTAPPPPPPPPANRGLKKKVLNSLPKFTYGDEENQQAAAAAAKLFDCAICLSEFAAGEEVRVLPQCGHGFHVVCIDTWLGGHSSCPSCRQVLEVSRCGKCGRLPASTCSAAAAQLNQPRQSHVDNFLP